MSLTNIAHATQEAEDCKQGICRLLGWSEEEYVDYQLDCGSEYLKHYLQADWATEPVKSSPVFWRWWRNHWAIRDKQILLCLSCGIRFQFGDRDLAPIYSVEEALDLYRYTHDPYELAQCIRPTGIVLHDSYAKMMQEAIDETL